MSHKTFLNLTGRATISKHSRWYTYSLVRKNPIRDEQNITELTPLEAERKSKQKICNYCSWMTDSSLSEHHYVLDDWSTVR